MCLHPNMDVIPLPSKTASFLLRDIQVYQDSMAPLVRERLRLQELSEKNYDIVKWNCQQF